MTGFARITLRSAIMFAACIFSFSNSNTLADTIWPIQPISSGFGATGPYAVRVDTIPSPQWRGKSVFVFHPAHSTKQFPLILFCHGFGAPDPTIYRPLINNIVSQGLVLIYSPYKTFAFDPSQKKKYRIMMKGFESAVTKFGSCIDTSCIGIIGHSYGAGAVPAIGWHCIIDNQWGKNGSFLYCMAPWYSYFLPQVELEAYPQKTYCIIETFDKDNVNDPRMAIDLFSNIAIPDSQKLFITLKSDSIPGYRLEANHSTPTGPADKGSTENALDYYGIYRFVDALAAFVFTGDTSANQLIRATGSTSQQYMGTWPNGRNVAPCIITRIPAPSQEPREYLNVWESAINPRRTESPTFQSGKRKNRFYYARKTFRNYWDFEKQKLANRRSEKLQSDTTDCSVPPIPTGFGAHGPYSMHTDSIPHPTWAGRFVHVFSPESISRPCPTIFFCHGYSKSNPENYLPLIMHIVSKGYCVVFSPYQNVALDPHGVKKYATLESGFQAAVSAFANKLDTTKIAYVGHSYGAGAIPALSLSGLVERKWGAAGTFLFLMAPFYSYEMDKIKLKLFPPTVSMVVQVYDEDRLIDHRMAISLFNEINIPQTNKNFLFVYSDTCNDIILKADHNTPKGPFDPNSEEDALDYYAIYRIFDALAAATFDKDPVARECALGKSKQTCFMGHWPNGKPVTPMLATGHPIPAHPQDTYSFSWGLPLNPLRNQIRLDK